MPDGESQLASTANNAIESQNAVQHICETPGPPFTNMI